MRTTRWISGLFCLALFAAAVTAQEPGAEKDVSFWLSPKAEIDLRALAPADVTFITGPDMRRGMILLQANGEAVIDFVPTNDDLKPFLPAKDSGYQIIPKGLTVGATPWGDRKYKIEKLPPGLARLTLLQTKMGHKGIVDANYGIIVNAAKPCLVFLALDQRVFDVYAQHGTPAWLQEFAPTGEQIKTDDPIMAQTDAAFDVYVRKSPGGRIVLGPPGMDISLNAMYFAFFAEAKE